MKRTRNASVDLGAAGLDLNGSTEAGASPVAPSSAMADPTVLSAPPDLNGSSDAAAATTRLLSPSSDPSALKRRRLDAPSTDDVLPASDAPAEAELTAAGQTGADQGDPADRALLTALAQAHEGDFDGHLGQDEVGLAEDGSAGAAAGAVDEGMDDRRLAAAEAAQLLQIFQAMAADLASDEGVLDRLPHAETDPSLQSTLRQLLTPSDEGPLRRDVESTLEGLSNAKGLAAVTSRGERADPSEAPAAKQAREVAEFARDALRVLDSVGGGRKGKGIAGRKRKVALYQRIASHPVHTTQLFGPRYFTEPIDIDSDEELDDTGNASVVEIHPTPELPLDQQPTLGQSSRPKQRKVKPPPAVKDTARVVSIFSREDPFMSFLPAYDSSAATISLSDTIVRLRRAEALEVARQEAEADPLPTWAPVGQSAAAESVDAMLRKNWERLARLREAQVARVRKGLAQAEEDESATAHELAETLSHLIALRPTPSILPGAVDLRALHRVVGLDNPPSSYRGTLDATRPLALADNTTLKVVYAQPPLPAPPLQQAPPQQPVTARQGSYGPTSTSGGQTYRAPPGQAQRPPSYPQQQQQQQQQQQPYQASPRLAYGSTSQGNSPMYGTGSPYAQQQQQLPPPQWQQGPPTGMQQHRPSLSQQLQQPLGQYANQQAYSQQQSAPIPMMGWKNSSTAPPPPPPSVQQQAPEGMW